MKNLIFEETETCFQTFSKFKATAGTESTVASHCAKGRLGTLLVGSSGILQHLYCPAPVLLQLQVVLG